MAQVAALRQAFVRIGFTNEAAQIITDVQGIDSLEEVRILTDEETGHLCKSIRRPGGMIANPNAAAGQPPQVPNPGVNVAMRAEISLKLMAYYLRHAVRVQRTVTAPDITLERIRSLRGLRDTEEAHEDPTEMPTINPKNWPKTMKAIEDYLTTYLGETGIPLAYVVRRMVALPPDPDDDYDSIELEMIRRAPHGNNNDVYVADNNKVYELIASMTRDLDCWTWVRPAQRSRDGRRAFYGLYNHYLGPNNVNLAAGAAETKLRTSHYDGEKRRWNFESYVTMQKEQHEILQDLMEYGYAGIDEGTKVRYLSDGIKTTELDVCKAQILASPALQQNFDECVTLYKDFLRGRSKDPTLNISELATTTESEVVEDRYYTRAEYEKLTTKQRDYLRSLRKERGHKRYQDPGKSAKKKHNRAIKKLQRRIAKLSK